MRATADPTGSSPGGGSVEVLFVGHATVLLSFPGLRVLTDPFLRPGLGPLVRHGPLPDLDSLRDIDVVLISHGHPDHLDSRSLAAIDGRPLVVVPRGLGSVTARATHGEVVEIATGETVHHGGALVTAVPARHWVSPGSPRATPVGFVVEAGPAVYFAGDTGRTDAMRALAGRVDLALLPVWTWGPHLGPGHLGPRSAAEALRDIGPAFAIPIHWATLYPRRLHRVWHRPLEEPGQRFAAFARQIAPDVDVRVLRPGDATSIVVVPARTVRPRS